jgi:hypothetical protein
MEAKHEREARLRARGLVAARRVAAVACAILLAAALGCVTEPKPTPTPIAQAPLNDTPQGAILRFVWAVNHKDLDMLVDLLTEDFTFEFSTVTDPTLAQQYQNGWFKYDEVVAARHLFEGYTDSLGHVHPAASKIEITLAKTLPVGDTEGRDPTRFQVLATRLDAIVEFPPVPPETEPTRYVIDNNFERIFLVRGDAALDASNNPTVPPGLPADSTRWYIYRWFDETNALGAAPGAVPVPTKPSTWGALKASYH